MQEHADAPTTDPRIRETTPADVADVVRLVHELAEYEKAPQECRLTAEQLEAALFGPRPALFGHVAEVDGGVVGFTLWFLNFSTWRGTHGIYLEDLYVEPAYRRHGLGHALLSTLAAECVRRGYSRLEWWVLDWNHPAIEFYESIGAVAMDEWTVYRLAEGALERMAHG
ncbi:MULTISPECIES: GNAT family N-acetyltransferase [unclassified Actinopolyspora]|uniref:GNAT family N-acetyltransferase n=1 Tax=unclassified Actinopolyspora TaxID=2639451 RepID=UPI0013F623A9|nr:MULTISPECIES: GNAT family N-acetyltransferase [unclassified Actinopolyspora]NHD18610.1 GNAT family N-acetyltransferase [Actinopolyspora sp. BKK2]NHE78068.1 GNAT family N-acetyltransferase [Actinopolyspora sp. BKK1]